MCLYLFISSSNAIEHGVPFPSPPPTYSISREALIAQSIANKSIHTVVRRAEAPQLHPLPVLNLLGI
jgi:hypothetical protein